MTPRRTDATYLRAVFALQTRGRAVSTSSLAAWLGVTSPTVSAMVKRLFDDGLVRHAAPRRLVLTPRGEHRALAEVRRHRLLETFLHRALDVPWDELHDEAEALGSVLSDRLEQRIEAALGSPSHDPHGDPIPPRRGPHVEDWGEPLAGVAPGSRVLVRRVADRDPEALRELEAMGVVPGAVVEVERLAPVGGPVWVRVGPNRHALGRELAAAVAVGSEA